MFHKLDSHSIYSNNKIAYAQTSYLTFSKLLLIESSLLFLFWLVLPALSILRELSFPNGTEIPDFS